MGGSSLLVDQIIIYGFMTVGVFGIGVTCAALMRATFRWMREDEDSEEQEETTPAENPMPQLEGEGNLLQFAEEVLSLKLTQNQAAEFLGIPREALNTLVASGELQRTKGRGGKLLDLAQLLEFKRNSGVGNNDTDD